MEKDSNPQYRLPQLRNRGIQPLAASPMSLPLATRQIGAFNQLNYPSVFFTKD